MMEITMSEVGYCKEVFCYRTSVMLQPIYVQLTVLGSVISASLDPLRRTTMVIARSEVLIVVSLRFQVFWDVMLCCGASGFS